MKKLSIAILTLFSAVFLFSSCSSDDSKNIALIGYWQCTGISGSILGQSTNLTQSSYSKVFSVAFVGASNGIYLRTDPTKLISSSTLSSSDSISNASDLSKFLSKGTYSCSGDNITLTDATNGAVTYTYTVSDNTLTLTQTVASKSSANTIVTSALNLISAFTGGTLESTGSITYSYTKMSTATLASLFNSSEAE